MSAERGSFQNAEKGVAGKSWEFFKKLVHLAPVLIAGVLGFAVGEKAAKH